MFTYIYTIENKHIKHTIYILLSAMSIFTQQISNNYYIHITNNKYIIFASNELLSWMSIITHYTK